MQRLWWPRPALHGVLGRGHGARSRVFGPVADAWARVLRLLAGIIVGVARVGILSIEHGKRIVPPGFQLVRKARAEGRVGLLRRTGGGRRLSGSSRGRLRSAVGNALLTAISASTKQTASDAAEAVASTDFRFANLVMIGTPSFQSTKRRNRNLKHDPQNACPRPAPDWSSAFGKIMPQL